MMADDESKEAFTRFGFAIRTFYLRANDLKIIRAWSREDTVSEDTEVFSASITGKARSEDEVAIIGETKRTNDFHFVLNANDPTKMWAYIKGNTVSAAGAQDETTPERKLIKLICDRLDEDPPTATLFLTEADWEIGTEEEWCIECTVSKDVHDQLVQDMLAGNANKINVGIEWEGGLVRDKHAPPSVTTTWGLFKAEADGSPEPLRGHVEFLTWELTPSQITFKGNEECKELKDKGD